MHNIKENWGEFREGSILALWYIAKNGYKVREGITVSDTKPKPYLVAGDTGRKIYPMLGNKSLHRNFARINPNDNNAIVSFANRYGLLGEAMGIFPVTGGELSYWGEPLSVWENEVANCRTFLDIWEMIQNEDAGKLGQIILWRSSPSVRVFASVHSKHRLLASKDVNSHLLKRWKFGYVIEPAFYFICSEVNKYLRGQFSFQLFPFNKQIYIMPRNLKAAIWFMFAREITDKPSLIQCPLCNDWFQQKDKREKYCSNACRQKAYRERKIRGGTK